MQEVTYNYTRINDRHMEVSASVIIDTLGRLLLVSPSFCVDFSATKLRRASANMVPL